MAEEHRDWTTTELARHLGVNDSYIRQLLLAGRLKGHKRGPIWLIPDEEVQRWLKSRRKRRR